MQWYVRPRQRGVGARSRRIGPALPGPRPRRGGGGPRPVGRRRGGAKSVAAHPAQLLRLAEEVLRPLLVFRDSTTRLIQPGQVRTARARSAVATLLVDGGRLSAALLHGAPVATAFLIQ